MEQILIVDDHADQREFLQFLLKKQEKDWVITEANNGKEALALCQEIHFDLIITDVKMPFLSGIELAEALRKNMVTTPILFISGYDDFEYVKKALTLQAVDYLLKPINPTEFHELIHRLIEESKEKKQKIVEQKELQNILKKQALTKLLENVPFFNLSQQEQTIAQELFTQKPFLCLIETKNHALPIFENYLKEKPDFYLYYYPINATQIILFCKSENSSRQAKELQLLKQHLRLVLSDQYALVFSVAIDSVPTLNEIFTHLKQDLALDFYQKPAMDGEKQILPSQDFRLEEQLIKEIKLAIQQQDFERVAQLFTDTFSLYQKSAYESPMLTKFFFANLFKIALESAKMILPNQKESLKAMLEAKTLQEIQPYFTQLVRLLSSRNQALGEQENEYIRETKNYILNHYHEELNLESFARHINLSPKYLSELFAREEGIGITKYLRNVRIEKAKELLKTSHYRVREISEIVGFNNYSYFIRNFRECVGLTPDAYRKAQKQVKL